MIYYNLFIKFGFVLNIEIIIYIWIIILIACNLYYL
jgi:hypothetical protein